MEGSLYDIQSMRQFVGLSLAKGSLADETTILNFRHLLERHQLATRMLTEINMMLSERGLLLKQGTIVDATIIAAPSSTKNKSGKRDPDMHQTHKGNNWHFGMKAHIGVDAESGLVHTVTTTPANDHDITQSHALVHGEEEAVFGGSVYIGVDKREDTEHIKAAWYVAMKPSQRRTIKNKGMSKTVEKLKSSKRQSEPKLSTSFASSSASLGLEK